MAKRVLIVEDDYAIRAALRELLELEGFEVSAFENGQAALDHLRTSARHPALILLDMMMPVMDGPRFLKHISDDQRLRALKVVVLTAGGEFPESGAVACLRKPPDVQALVETVHRHCR